MSSVSSVNPGVANLLRTLSNIDSPLLSSPAAVSALENAPPGDIVKLSAAATQLEGVDAMFGIADATAASTAGSLASLAGLPTGSLSAASEAQDLFGAGTTADPADSLFDLTG
jgi:hypothetical protein